MSEEPVERRPSMLAPFAGEKPPAPAWFTDALAHAPERSTYDCDGAAIELLTWGDVGKPGLLFLHGNAAHAEWWSFIAPFFASDYRCAAISWSGMGNSDWRPAYSMDHFAQEALRAITVARLDHAGPPVILGHSFGGFVLMHFTARHPQALAAGIIVDSLVPTADLPARRWAAASGMLPRYRTLADALARFRFAPEQDSDYPAIVDHIARNALRKVEGADGQEEWTWKFDPRFWTHFDRDSLPSDYGVVRAPMGLIYGERSLVVKPEGIAQAAAGLPDCRFVAQVPLAEHHIMADQPIALVAALRLGLSSLANQRARE